MKKWKIAFLALIIISFGANLGWWQAWSGSQAEKVSLQGQLSFYREELKANEAALADTKTQLKNTTGHVSLLADELNGVRKELEGAQADLVSQKAYYDNKLFEEIKLAKAAGAKEALSKGVLLRNPTYAELKAFLASTIILVVSGATCVDFAATLNSAGEDAGFRTAFVFLVYSYPNQGKWGHFINGFQTTDRGMIYIEPQIMKEVPEVEVGKRYIWSTTVVPNIIREIIVIW